MKPSSLYGHSVELLDFYRAGKIPADELIAEFYRKRRYLGAKDRRWISEQYYGVLRHFKKLRFLIARSVPPVKGPGESAPPSLMFVAAYEILVHGAPWQEISECIGGHWRVVAAEIDCAAWCETLAGSDRSIGGEPGDRISIEYSMPAFAVRQWLSRYGEEQTVELCAALNTPARISMRVNTLKTSVQACIEALGAEGVTVHPLQLSPTGIVADRRFASQGLKSFQNGLFEMQDEGSQFLSLLVDPQPGETVLDACAGGGGKSLHMAALMQNNGVLIARDTNLHKLNNTSVRAARAGATIVRVLHTGDEAAESFAGTIDRVLIDAPCSGTGTFRRNPGLKMVVTKEVVDSRVTLQRAVLSECAGFPKHGGRLVYATCSLLQEENEGVVSWFLDRYPEYSLVPPGSILEIAGDDDTVTFLPHRSGTDGFFAAIMVRS